MVVRAGPHDRVAERPLRVDAGQRHDLVPGRERRLRLGDHHVPLAQDRHERGVGWQAELVEGLARVRGLLGEPHLDQRDLPALQPQEADQVPDRHRLLDHRRQDVRRRDGRVDAPLLVEQPLVLGVVHAGEHAGDTELLLGEQRRHEVVLVVTGGGHHDVGRPNVGLLEDAGLARVAVHDPRVRGPRVELLRELAALLHERHVVSPLGEILGEMAPDRTAARDDDLHA